LTLLRQAREAAGFSVSQLARAALVSDRIITGLEQVPVGATCRQPIADQIALALGCTLEQLGQVLL
jgi:transcriptional regulator with XRE-family HTH domain